MHLLMVLAAVAVAVGLRSRHLPVPTGRDRWRRAIVQLVCPALLWIATAIAVVCMGTSGQMVWWGTGRSSYVLSVGFLLFAIGCILVRALKLQIALWNLRRTPVRNVLGYRCRVLDDDLLFSAQVGGWNPELTVTQGLLDRLDDDRLAAVLAHEEGHRVYRDTFWFFWLGLCRQITAVLPHTEAIWQDLLLLRELRADGWAAQQVDELLLAESLLEVVRSPLRETESFQAAFSCAAPRSRLEQRIDALLSGSSPTLAFGWQGLLPLMWALLPLATVPFHH